MGGQLIPGPEAGEQERWGVMERGLASRKGREGKEEAGLWLVGGGEDTCGAVGFGGGLCLSWGLPGRSEALQPLPAARAPLLLPLPLPPTPRQRKKQGLPGPKLQPSCFLGQAGGKQGWLNWLPPSPRARPSCVVSLVGLPWRREARPAPTHGNYSQGVSHWEHRLPHHPGQADAPTPIPTF